MGKICTKDLFAQAEENSEELLRAVVGVNISLHLVFYFHHQYLTPLVLFFSPIVTHILVIFLPSTSPPAGAGRKADCRPPHSGLLHRSGHSAGRTRTSPVYSLSLLLLPLPPFHWPSNDRTPDDAVTQPSFTTRFGLAAAANDS